MKITASFSSQSTTIKENEKVSLSSFSIWLLLHNLMRNCGAFLPTWPQAVWAFLSILTSVYLIEFCKCYKSIWLCWSLLFNFHEKCFNVTMALWSCPVLGGRPDTANTRQYFIKLETKVREVFTITEKAAQGPFSPFSGWKRLLPLWHLRIYQDTMLNMHLQ